MQRATRLAALKYIQGDQPEQVTAYYLRDHHLQKTLSVISQAPVSIHSFSERVRTLNFMDSESVIHTLGYKRGEPKLTDYRDWDPSRVSLYSKTLQEQAELLCRGREYVQDILEGSATDRLQVLLEDMNTHLEETKKHKNIKWSDATCTHLDVIRRSYNLIQSHLTVNQMLPEIATKMYNDLCSLHSGASKPLTGKNKTRSRPWTDALSELRFAVSNLRSSAWNIDPDILIDIEQKADGFFTELTDRQEGPIREGHMAALTKRDLDDPTYGPPPQRFRLTRLNELESYMEAKRAEVTQMMANVDMGWKDISGSNFKWSEVTTPTVSRQSESLFVSDPVNKVKVLTFCQCKWPIRGSECQAMLLSPEVMLQMAVVIKTICLSVRFLPFPPTLIIRPIYLHSNLYLKWLSTVFRPYNRTSAPTRTHCFPNSLEVKWYLLKRLSTILPFHQQWRRLSSDPGLSGKR